VLHGTIDEARRRALLARFFATWVEPREDPETGGVSLGASPARPG
jgi:hypothetical protein